MTILLSTLRILCFFNLVAYVFSLNIYVLIGINSFALLFCVLLLCLLKLDLKLSIFSILIIVISFGIHLNTFFQMNKELYGIIGRLYLYLFIGIIILFELSLKNLLDLYKDQIVSSWIVTSQFVMLAGFIGVLSSLFNPPTGLNLILWIILVFVAFIFYVFITLLEWNYINNKRKK